MADAQQLAVLHQGVDAWNAWRKQNPNVRVDLSGARLIKANLSKAHLVGALLFQADLTEASLSGANLTAAHLVKAKLIKAKLSGADTVLRGANLTMANLSGADLTGARLVYVQLREAHALGTRLSRADLTGASLSGADLTGADLTGAGLSGADLFRANLVRTNFTEANLTGCRVYGVSAWDLKLDGAVQKDLLITPPGEPEITVDNLEVAQFIYLLLKNEKIRHVIDTITSKVVLILGRFTDGRKVVLDALREELRLRGYTPVLFDFDKPANRTTVETVSTLAHMARFVIADLTDARSVLQELQAIVPTNPSVPVQPLILATQGEPGMFDHFRDYRWMLEPYRYPEPGALLAALTDNVILPAEAKLCELRGITPPTA